MMPYRSAHRVGRLGQAALIRPLDHVFFRARSTHGRTAAQAIWSTRLAPHTYTCSEGASVQTSGTWIDGAPRRCEEPDTGPENPRAPAQYWPLSLAGRTGHNLGEALPAMMKKENRTKRSEFFFFDIKLHLRVSQNEQRSPGNSCSLEGCVPGRRGHKGTRHTGYETAHITSLDTDRRNTPEES